MIKDNYIDSYRVLKSYDNNYLKLKDILKKYIIRLNKKNTINTTKGWIQFPFYHHVFNDENKNFLNQLNHMKNFGDFVSYNESLEILKNGFEKKNNYFCLSFDDGFSNNLFNICDVLDNKKIPTMFFIPTTFIDNKRNDSGKIFFNNSSIEIEFLTWTDCKKISINNLFTFGSHSLNHRLLSQLSDEESFKELQFSKLEIEDHLKVKCEHFAPPVGDYLNPRDINYCKEIGYKSLSTTVRGKMNDMTSNPYLLKRHHLLANWNLDYLNYFLNR